MICVCVCVCVAYLHLGVPYKPEGAALKQLEQIAGGHGEQRMLVPLVPHPLQPVLVPSIAHAVALSSELTHLSTTSTWPQQDAVVKK